MIAAVATHGNVVINNIIPSHLEAISAKLMECGARITEGDDGTEFFMQVQGGDRLRAVNIKTLPYPGFPTDLQQPMMALLTMAKGNSYIVENIFEERFNHVPELVRMGASIHVNGRTATIEGVDKLYGASVRATDLRAGAALIVAALAAEGTTIVRNIHFIDRATSISSRSSARSAPISKGWRNNQNEIRAGVQRRFVKAVFQSICLGKYSAVGSIQLRYCIIPFLSAFVLFQGLRYNE